jgi:hypothetical protein
MEFARVVARLCFFFLTGVVSLGTDGAERVVLHAGGWVRLLAAVVRVGEVQTALCEYWL